MYYGVLLPSHFQNFLDTYALLILFRQQTETREELEEKQENASQVKKRLPTPSSTVTLPPLSYLTQSINGQVSEWSNEHAWKVCVLATVPRVRIPPCPPFYSFHNLAKSLILQGFFIS